MYAWVTRWPDLKPEGVEDFRVNTVPAASQLDSITEILLLVDEGSGRAITITLWDTEEAMLAREPTAQRLRNEDVDSGLAGEQPVVERYKLAVREILYRAA